MPTRRGFELSLSRKLGLLFAVLTFGFVVIALLSVLAADHVDSSLTHVEKLDVPSQLQSRLLADLFTSIARRYEDAAMTGDKSLLDQNIQDTRKFRREVAAMSQALSADVSAQQLGTLSNAFDDFDAWQRGLTEAMLQIEDDGHMLAADRLEHLSAAAALARTRVESALRDIRDERNAHLSSQLQSVRVYLVRLVHKIALVAALAAILWLGVLIYSREYVVKPIVVLSQVAAEVAHGNLYGNLDAQLQSLRSSNDEVGQLALRVRAMVTGLRATTVSKEYVEDIVESMADALVVVDRDGLIQLANPAAGALVGAPAESFTGRTIADVLPEAATFRKTDGSSFTVTRGQKSHCLTSLGTQLPVSISVALLRSDSGAVFVMRDMRDQLRADDERRQLEVQLLQAAKLESVGRLAAGVAHEINTPMQFIGDNTRFLSEAVAGFRETLAISQQLLAASRTESFHPDITRALDATIAKHDIDFLLEESASAASQSLEGIQRVRDIVVAMKDFSHPGSEDRVAVDINRALRTTLTVSRNEWKYVAEVEENLQESLPLVYGLGGPLNQMLLNIIINASHAIADTQRVRAGGLGKIRLITRAVDEGRVEIRIGDDGNGIPKKIRERIFDPFFTTKEIGKGTGQGLAIARSVVVDQHGGTIDVESQEGVGTTFIIRLPTAPSTSDAATDAELSEVSVG